MDVFDCGSRSVARERLNSFFEEMDEAGESYGYASGESDEDPVEISPDAPFVDLPDDDAAHAILLVEGTAEVGGGEGATFHSTPDRVPCGSRERLGALLHSVRPSPSSKLRVQP
jgi:hypothetical protein